MPGFTRFSSALVPVAAGRRRTPGFIVGYLVQAGGGGTNGGSYGFNWPNAAAAGTARFGNVLMLPGTSMTVTVGAGGGFNANGSASTLSSITASGGEFAGPSSTRGGNNADFLGFNGAATTAGGAGAGSGGNAGIAGGKAANTIGGDGYVWFGDNTRRGGGGSTTGQSGGLGGGGFGSGPDFSPAGNGATNTGSGAGAGNFSSGGALGGSGVVILRYPNTEANITTISGGLTFSFVNNVATGFKTYTFTAGTGPITW
jgi:hypothetical protein